VILITLDTTRADRLGGYGDPDASTPTLDRLVREGTLFEEAWTTTPVTLPSHASILTGNYPVTHGARDNAIFVLGDDDNETLAEILRRHGYATGAVISAFVLDRRFGLAQGFDLYDDDPSAMASAGPRIDPERTADDATRAALDAVDELGRGGKPLFLWVHYFDPHTPFDPPEPYRSRRAASPGDRYSGYDGEIAFVDRALDRLLEGLSDAGALDDAIVAIVGDHGEGLESPHEESSHGILVFEETVRVPWILWDSRGTLRRTPVSGPVSVVDVLPTVLDLAGVDSGDGIAGISLVPAIGNGVASSDRTLLAETYHPYYLYAWSPLSTVRRGDWKFIRSPDSELYDLANDPAERRDLAERSPEQAARIASRLDELVARWERAPSAAGFSLSEAEEEKLRSLGYLAQASAGRTPPPRDELPDKNPRTLLPLHRDLQLAVNALADGDAPRVRELLSNVLSKDPENVLALRYYGDFLAQSGDLDGAIRVYRRAVAIHPDLHELHDNLGTFLMRRGDACRAEGRLGDARALYREAEEAFRAAIEAFPLHHYAMSNLAALYVNWWPEPRLDEAEAWLRRAIEIEPRSYHSHLVYGWLLRIRERWDEAIAELMIVAGLQETGFGEFLLGECHLGRGDREKAREHFRRSLELEPGLDDARARLRELER
jgi:arylsulfatase A-like enzyme/Tfp pilus assembly protein PilF